MNRMMFVYVGLLAMVIASYLGLVEGTEAGQAAPSGTAINPDGLVAQGRRAYIGLGCVYCHTQQVRPEGFGVDRERGWGIRRTTSADYEHDAPPLLGTMRTGPDLATIGARQPSSDWHYLHLYDPTIVSPGSNMPRFPFLFDIVTPVGKPLDGVAAPKGVLPEGSYLRPTAEARALVTYLRSLDKTRDPDPEDEP